MSHEKLVAAIRMTIGDIDDELTASEPLLKLGMVRDFDFIETFSIRHLDLRRNVEPFSIPLPAISWPCSPCPRFGRRHETILNDS